MVSTGGTPILATIRTLYGGSSYYEMFGVPADQLTSTYWFPWYNDTAMSTELHLAVP